MIVRQPTITLFVEVKDNDFYDEIIRLTILTVYSASNQKWVKQQSIGFVMKKSKTMQKISTGSGLRR